MIVDTLTREHSDGEWIDIYGNRWAYMQRNGWVVRRKGGKDFLARFGGWNPDDYGPFSEAPDEGD